MIQHMYLYLDNFSFSDYFSTNDIACEAFLPNKKGTRTLSRDTQNFLFVTHKKIDEESRLAGISDQLTSWPVTLGISIDTEQFEKFPVVFLKNSDDIALELGDIKNYNQEEHIGCFVLGELPFSLVEKIMFENDDQLNDSDKSIFPDFMWKASKANIIPKDEFTEKLSLSIEESKLFEAMSIDSETAQKLCLHGNKYRAAVLQLVNGTKEWHIGKYKTSFDSVVQSYFDISTDTIRHLLVQKSMPIPDAIFEATNEPLALILDELTVSNAETDQDIYNIIVKTLVANSDKVSPTVIKGILASIKKSITEITSIELATAYAKSIDAIEGCTLNAVGFSVGDTLNTIANQHGIQSPLIALFFTLKNPTEFEKFVLSLNLYKVDSVSARRSMVLWGFLNGTKGIPATKYNRDNDILWKNIEWRNSISSSNNNALPVLKKPVDDVNNPCGIEMSSEEIISYEDVYSFLCDSKNLTKGILNDIYSVAKNIDRNLSKNDPYSQYNISSLLEELHKVIDGQESSVGLAVLKDMEKDIKKCTTLINTSKKNPEIDYRTFHRDWVVDPVKFKKIWEVLEPKLKEFYFRRRGQK